jgi:hypothetical protein
MYSFLSAKSLISFAIISESVSIQSLCVTPVSSVNSRSAFDFDCSSMVAEGGVLFVHIKGVNLAEIAVCCFHKI